MDAPKKNWKPSEAGMREDARWKHDMRTCEERIGATSGAKAPRHVTPADDRRHARLMVATTAAAAYESGSCYPKVDVGRWHELLRKRRQLVK